MQLPEDCPFAVMPEGPFAVLESLFVQSNECFDCCRVHAWLLALEEPLCRSQRIESEAYRFIWSSSFHGTAVVHITRQGDAFALRWKYLRFRAPSEKDAPPIAALSPIDWDRLQHYLEATNFWSLNPVGNEMGFDGAQWLIEGRRGDIYRAVQRWSPGGAIYDLGRLFFALSGPPLSGVKLY
jgi:hypothetical protein